MTVSPVFERKGLLFERDVIKKSGEMPHIHHDGFRKLWLGGTVELSELGLDEVSRTVYYTELGNVGSMCYSPSETVGRLTGVNSERVVAAVEVR